MRKTIIVGRGNAVSRIMYNTVTKASTAIDYEACVPAGTQSEVRINTLGTVVRTIEQLKEKGFTADTEPSMFLVPGVLSDIIHNGTSNFWLLNGGKKNDGTPIHEVELELWTRFNNLLNDPDVRLHVCFKDVGTATIPAKPRFPVSPEQRLDAEFAQKAWDRCKPTTPEMVESEDAV